MKVLKIVLTLLVLTGSGVFLWAQGTQPGSSIPPAVARMTTLVDNFLGIGDETPEVRLVFEIVVAELCLTIAVQPGPRALRAQLFQFSKRTAEGNSLKPLKFKLPKKGYRPEGQEDRVRVWDACAAREVAEPTEQASILIQYRDPRHTRELAKYTIPYPEITAGIGADIHKDSAGNLIFSSYWNPSAEKKKRLPE